MVQVERRKSDILLQVLHFKFVVMQYFYGFFVDYGDI
jgi:hypothetical protein